MIHFVGAGPGAVDLITVRGQQLIREADVIIYAGSLVNPDLLLEAKPDCSIYNSASMTLEEVIGVMVQAEQESKQTVRLHTGDPSLYGAIREQMDCLNQHHIPYQVVPGVSSFVELPQLCRPNTPCRMFPKPLSLPEWLGGLPYLHRKKSLCWPSINPPW